MVRARCPLRKRNSGHMARHIGHQRLEAALIPGTLPEYLTTAISNYGKITCRYRYRRRPHRPGA
jgi:hypothetical protein